MRLPGRRNRQATAPGIRELLRLPISPLHLAPGDSVRLTWHDHGDGTTTDLGTVTVDDAYVFTEGVIFDAGPGVFGKGRALGGVLVE